MVAGTRSWRATLVAAVLGATGGVARGDGDGDGNASSDSVVIPECARGLDLPAAQRAEIVCVYDQRPGKPFERDTEVRLTGEQLAARGAVDLATALQLLPDVTMHDAGRGGFNIDVRGGRKGEVSIVIDGVLVTDPFYGTFDLSSIPITDIVQIRVATTPQSPIDGPGGPGGVVEVSTRDAIGRQLVIVRLAADTLPSAGATATARAPIGDHTALRLSLGDTAGGHDYTLDRGASQVGEDRHDANGAARLEYRDGDRRVAADVFVDSRHYIAPPNENQDLFLDIDRETTLRAGVKGDDRVAGFQIQSEVGAQYLHRVSRTFTDPTRTTESVFEDLQAWRESAFALATRPIAPDWRWAASATLLHDSCDVATLARTPTTGDGGELEPAADVQYAHGAVRVDGAVGETFPIGLGASPYPEAKLIARWRPRRFVELAATVGRKGRVPTLQERFEPYGGNAKLAPEQADHAELRAIAHVDDRLHVEVAPFVRHTDGIIRESPATDATDPTYGKLVNLGVVDIWGVDVLGRARVAPIVEVGGGWSYIQARADPDPGGPSDVIDDHPLNRLPANRVDAWVQVTPLPRLSAIARAIYFGANYGGMMGTTVLLPGYTTYQATLTWQIDRTYLLVVRGDDLTDVRPQTRPHVYGDGTEITAILQATFD